MEPITEELKTLNWPKALLRVLELLIITPFTLPLKIYINTLKNLSNAKSEHGEINQLSNEFPLYVWLISLFDALIFLAYPIGILWAFFKGFGGYFGGFGLFSGILIATYFTPLYFSLIREFAQIALKTILYLKIIALKK